MLQSMGSPRVKHDLASEQQQQFIKVYIQFCTIMNNAVMSMLVFTLFEFVLLFSLDKTHRVLNAATKSMYTHLCQDYR